MITHLRRAITCHWSARRIGRYLDHDPSAPLTASEIRRLEDHLSICEKCAHVTAEHRALRRALDRWGQQRFRDDEAMTRIHDSLDRIVGDGR